MRNGWAARDFFQFLQLTNLKEVGR